MEFRDKSLVCMDCHEAFVWTAGEQLFYHDRNLKNEPKRCKPCKARRQAGPEGRDRVATSAVCARCGRETTLPFRPTQGRPVYCKECFERIKAAPA